MCIRDRDAVCAAGKEQFAGRIDLYPSSPFFIETDGAADAAVGQEVHLPAEGRDVQIFAAVAADSHQDVYKRQRNFILSSYRRPLSRAVS